MNDELNNPLYMALIRQGRKTWRRRRKHEGKNWTPPAPQDVSKGVWCPACSTRHPYNGTGRALTRYEKRGEHFVLMWLCPRRGNVIGEIPLGGKA
jgi:hypothetical protein